MLIDMHAHTSAISPCCLIPAPEVLAEAKAAGLDGIVLTNHYDKSYVKDGDAAAFARRYLDEFEYTRECGNVAGMCVIFGIEVTMAKHQNVHMLVYGVDEEFLMAHPDLYDCTQEELYALVHAYGGAMIQAHPFRGGRKLLDTKYMDGVEINCHPLYNESRWEDLVKIADDSRFIVTCGGDYHADTYRPRCGTYLPECITDTGALARHLLETKEITIRIHEPNTEEPFELKYDRKGA